MSWYREGDGTIVVEDGHELLKDHLNHGFWVREDGKVVLLDYDLLYLCGKEHKKRRFLGRRSSEEVTMSLPYRKAIEILKKDYGEYHLCPKDKSKCRFWNNLFEICSIHGNDDAKKREKVPCIRDDEYDEQRAD
jgi:hypothetical protein